MSSKRNATLAAAAAAAVGTIVGVMGIATVSSVGAAPQTSVPHARNSVVVPDEQYDGGHFSSESDGSACGVTAVKPDLTC